MVRKSWNKGLTKENNEKLRLISLKCHLANKDKPSRRKGISKYSNIKEYCSDNYTKFMGSRAEFAKFIKDHFKRKESEETLIYYIKNLKIKKPKLGKSINKECYICKKHFKLYPSEIRKGQFCSQKCKGYLSKLPRMSTTCRGLHEQRLE